MLIFISWIALSFIVASTVGKHRQIGYGSTLLIWLIFSPLIGLLIAGFSPAVGTEVISRIGLRIIRKHKNFMESES